MAIEYKKIQFRIDWQTPDKYLDAARKVLGEIDLDPASDVRANIRIKAKRYYTIDDSGLEHKWDGNVWLAPPYKLLPQFIDKLVEEYENGSVKQCILLTHTLTTWEPWFQKLLSKSKAVCFVNELIAWVPGHLPELLMAKEVGIDISKAPKYDVRGSILVYFGIQPDKFIDVFRRFGWTIKT